VKVIYFDGFCVLCNNFIKWVVANDPKKKIKISMIHGERYKKLALNNPQLKNIDSVIYENEEGIFLKGAAVRKIIHDLSTFQALKIASNIVPLFLLNFYYNLVAKARYKIFGKYDVCPPLPAEWKERFLP
jgi:predicted DCC family thiol-disulfide oxidoreductase YuxK